MYVSRLLERVRAVSGRRSPGRHSAAYVPPVVANRPTPDVRGARVVPLAEDVGGLVRPYLFTPDEWRRARLAARLERVWWQ